MRAYSAIWWAEHRLELGQTLVIQISHLIKMKSERCNFFVFVAATKGSEVEPSEQI